MEGVTSLSEARPRIGDALVVVDVQNDFLPGGALAVPEGDQVVTVLNRYMDVLTRLSLPVFATRDWHTKDHCSFHAQGGPWPPHCIAGTSGAQFAADLQLPSNVVIISKGTRQEEDAYSGFQGTGLQVALVEQNIHRLFIGGLATDYCVLETVKDGVASGFQVLLLLDAIRAVNVEPQHGEEAVEQMKRLGARPITYEG